MKIEMGESLFYSWLRHVKECQVVQTNWKVSNSWQLQDEKELERFMDITDNHFKTKYGYVVYGNNSLFQLIKQAEVDVLGTAISSDGMEIYAVDVAFHKNGLNYSGGRQVTVERVVEKFLRTALCIRGYFGITKAELIFASPKIHDAVIKELQPCVADLNSFLLKNDYNFTARVISNDSFYNLVLNPILIASDGISDTSELFMRGYQLIKMFESEQCPTKPRVANIAIMDGNNLSELKVGKIAQRFLRDALQSGNVSEEEIIRIQDKQSSKNDFGIEFPLLVQANGVFDPVRYYVKPLTIRGIKYRMCSQWYARNKQSLLNWLDEHKKSSS